MALGSRNDNSGNIRWKIITFVIKRLKNDFLKWNKLIFVLNAFLIWIEEIKLK